MSASSGFGRGIATVAQRPRSGLRTGRSLSVSCRISFSVMDDVIVKCYVAMVARNER